MWFSQGHDHVYLRTGVMNNNEVVQTKTKTVTYGGRNYTAKLDPTGSIYVISGCSGVKTYVTKDPAETDKLFPRAEKLADANDPIFSAFQIVGDTLYFDAYTVGADGNEPHRFLCNREENSGCAGFQHGCFKA